MAKIVGPKKVQRYSEEFKLKAVKLSQIKGVQVEDVANALQSTSPPFAPRLAKTSSLPRPSTWSDQGVG